MTVDDLMRKLVGLFPRSFAKPETLATWTEIAHEGLDRYAGTLLQVAFDKVMAGWTKGYAPKLGDFLAVLQEGQAGAASASDDWPTRRRTWVDIVLSNPGKYNSDAERVARALAREHGYPIPIAQSSKQPGRAEWPTDASAAAE